MEGKPSTATETESDDSSSDSSSSSHHVLLQVQEDSSSDQPPMRDASERLAALTSQRGSAMEFLVAAGNDQDAQEQQRRERWEELKQVEQRQAEIKARHERLQQLQAARHASQDQRHQQQQEQRQQQSAAIQTQLEVTEQQKAALLEWEHEQDLLLTVPPDAGPNLLEVLSASARSILQVQEIPSHEQLQARQRLSQGDTSTTTTNAMEESLSDLPSLLQKEKANQQHGDDSSSEDDSDSSEDSDHHDHSNSQKSSSASRRGKKSRSSSKMSGGSSSKLRAKPSNRHASMSDLPTLKESSRKSSSSKKSSSTNTMEERRNDQVHQHAAGNDSSSDDNSDSSSDSDHDHSNSRKPSSASLRVKKSRSSSKMDSSKSKSKHSSRHASMSDLLTLKESSRKSTSSKKSSNASKSHHHRSMGIHDSSRKHTDASSSSKSHHHRSIGGMNDSSRKHTSSKSHHHRSIMGGSERYDSSRKSSSGMNDSSRKHTSSSKPKEDRRKTLHRQRSGSLNDITKLMRSEESKSSSKSRPTSKKSSSSTKKDHHGFSGMSSKLMEISKDDAAAKKQSSLNKSSSRRAGKKPKDDHPNKSEKATLEKSEKALDKSHRALDKSEKSHKTLHKSDKALDKSDKAALDKSDRRRHMHRQRSGSLNDVTKSEKGERNDEDKSENRRKIKRKTTTELDRSKGGTSSRRSHSLSNKDKEHRHSSSKHPSSTVVKSLSTSKQKEPSQRANRTSSKPATTFVDEPEGVTTMDFPPAPPLHAVDDEDTTLVTMSTDFSKATTTEQPPQLVKGVLLLGDKDKEKSKKHRSISNLGKVLPDDDDDDNNSEGSLENIFDDTSGKDASSSSHHNNAKKSIQQRFSKSYHPRSIPIEDAFDGHSSAQALMSIVLDEKQKHPKPETKKETKKKPKDRRSQLQRQLSSSLSDLGKFEKRRGGNRKSSKAATETPAFDWKAFSPKVKASSSNKMEMSLSEVDENGFAVFIKKAPIAKDSTGVVVKSKEEPTTKAATTSKKKTKPQPPSQLMSPHSEDKESAEISKDNATSNNLAQENEQQAALKLQSSSDALFSSSFGSLGTKSNQPPLCRRSAVGGADFEGDQDGQADTDTVDAISSPVLKKHEHLAHFFDEDQNNSFVDPDEEQELNEVLSQHSTSASSLMDSHSKIELSTKSSEKSPEDSDTEQKVQADKLAALVKAPYEPKGRVPPLDRRGVLARNRSSSLSDLDAGNFQAAGTLSKHLTTRSSQVAQATADINKLYDWTGAAAKKVSFDSNASFVTTGTSGTKACYSHLGESVMESAGPVSAEEEFSYQPLEDTESVKFDLKVADQTAAALKRVLSTKAAPEEKKPMGPEYFEEIVGRTRGRDRTRGEKKSRSASLSDLHGHAKDRPRRLTNFLEQENTDTSKHGARSVVDDSAGGARSVVEDSTRASTTAVGEVMKKGLSAFLTNQNSVASKVGSKSVMEGSSARGSLSVAEGSRGRRSASTTRSTAEDSKRGPRKTRSIAEGFKRGPSRTGSIAEGSKRGPSKTRSIADGSKRGQRTSVEGSSRGHRSLSRDPKKRRSLSRDPKKRRSLSRDPKKRRSASREPKKRRSLSRGRGKGRPTLHRQRSRSLTDVHKFHSSTEWRKNTRSKRLTAMKKTGTGENTRAERMPPRIRSEHQKPEKNARADLRRVKTSVTPYDKFNASIASFAASASTASDDVVSKVTQQVQRSIASKGAATQQLSSIGDISSKTHPNQFDASFPIDDGDDGFSTGAANSLQDGFMATPKSATKQTPKLDRLLGNAKLDNPLDEEAATFNDSFVSATPRSATRQLARSGSDSLLEELLEASNHKPALNDETATFNDSFVSATPKSATRHLSSVETPKLDRLLGNSRLTKDSFVSATPRSAIQQLARSGSDSMLEGLLESSKNQVTLDDETATFNDSFASATPRTATRHLSALEDTFKLDKLLSKQPRVDDMLEDDAATFNDPMLATPRSAAREIAAAFGGSDPNLGSFMPDLQAPFVPANTAPLVLPSAADGGGKQPNPRRGHS